MPENKSESREFLDRFTKGIVENIRKELVQKEQERKKEESAKREVEIGKLKKRFEDYGEKKAREEKKPEEKKLEGVKIELKRPETVKPLMPTLLTPRPLKPVMPLKPLITPPAAKPSAIPPKRPERPRQITRIPIPPARPAAPGEIDFGKITFLVKDPLVMYIECPGVNKNILIRRAREATITTQIMLNKNEISNIVRSFSEKARIPLIEGMLKARVGNIELTAVVSEVTSPSFIIKKILLPPTAGPTQLERPPLPAPAAVKETSAIPPITRPFTGVSSAPFPAKR